MDVLEVLYTTRAVRRFLPVDKAGIDDDLLMQLLDVAIRAPNAGNRQLWRFVVVRNRDTMERLRQIYADIVAKGGRRRYTDQESKVARGVMDDDTRSYERMMSGVESMARDFANIPVIVVVVFVPDDHSFISGGSIYPAVWSLQLAARSFGVGSVNVGALARRGEDVLEILGVPADEGWHVAACVALGFPVGGWSVPRRRPAHEVTFEEVWGRRPDWEARVR